MSSSAPAKPTVWPGTAYPLGATYDGTGTNFSLFSEVADRVLAAASLAEALREIAPLWDVAGLAIAGQAPTPLRGGTAPNCSPKPSAS